MSASDLRATRTPVALALIALVVSALVFVTGAPAGASGVTRSSGQLPSHVEADTTTSLLPLSPCRLFDARHTPDLGRIDADTWRLRVVDRCGVPATARAVSISIVATGTTAAGFVTVHPDGTARPDASNLNYERGNTVANSAVVKLGPSGSIDVFTSVPADIIIDVTGAFVDAPAAVGEGRFVGVDPRRVVDTRLSGERGDSEIRVSIPSGIPGDASALAVSITAVGAATSGFLSVYPAGGVRSDTSVVNTDEQNDTRANAVFASVDRDGFVVFRSTETDVLVDVWGWFTGPSAPLSTDGLFVPQPPRRAWDSRSTSDPIHRGGTVEKQPLVEPAAAIVANVTVVDPTGWGFVSVFAAGTPMPDVSSLNYRWRQPVAALTVSRVSDRGVALYSYAGAHTIVDVAGWFTGAAAASTTPPPVNEFPAGDSDVLMISDSAFAGIRWAGRALPPAGRSMGRSSRVVSPSDRCVVSRTRRICAADRSDGTVDGSCRRAPHPVRRHRLQRLVRTVPLGCRSGDEPGAGEGHRPCRLVDVSRAGRIRVAGRSIEPGHVRSEQPPSGLRACVGTISGTHHRRLEQLLAVAPVVVDRRRGAPDCHRCPGGREVPVAQAGVPRTATVPGGHRWTDDSGRVVPVSWW
jgi:hypothetical protein